jgi:hypothetical protein
VVLPRQSVGALGTWTPTYWPRVHKIEVNGVLVEPGIEPGSVYLNIGKESVLFFRRDVEQLLEAVKEIAR